ncbi:hypothetical protein QLX08_003232 [Tetragonisca angustula]|uniref:Uncharacterized protein n=1 Tax=Tetragonisca angustula TaxID=166442 RepID=A0AAW1AAE4_9HYME
MYLTGDHVSRREGEDGISSPLVKQEDRCLLRYRKSRRRAEPAGRERTRKILVVFSRTIAKVEHVSARRRRRSAKKETNTKEEG